VSEFPVRWIWGEKGESCNTVCGRHGSVCRRSKLSKGTSIGYGSFWGTLPTETRARCKKSGSGNGDMHPAMAQSNGIEGTTWSKCYTNSATSSNIPQTACASTWNIGARLCPCFGPTPSTESVTFIGNTPPSWHRLHTTSTKFTSQTWSTAYW
jgi:hypothetical protein